MSGFKEYWNEHGDAYAMEIAEDAWDYQQAKIDELKCELKRINLWYSNVKLQLENKEIDSAIDAKKIDELQKRVDAAKYYMKNIFSVDAEVDQCHLGDLLDILDGKIVDEIEQALKGGDKNTEKQPNKHAENIATKGVKGGDQ